MILFCLELFQQIEGAIAQILSLTMPAHGKEHGDGGVDNHQV